MPGRFLDRPRLQELVEQIDHLVVPTGRGEPIHLNDVRLLSLEALGESSEPKVDYDEWSTQKIVDRNGHTATSSLSSSTQ